MVYLETFTSVARGDLFYSDLKLGQRPLRVRNRCGAAYVVSLQVVLMTLLGRPIKWNAQQRTASGTTWSEALRAHGVATLFASGWIAAVSWLNATVFVWLLPVAIPLLLSIPLSLYSSRVSLGDASRRWQLFHIPEEKKSRADNRRLRRLLDQRRILPPNALPAKAPLHADNVGSACAHPQVQAAPADPPNVFHTGL